MAVNACFNYDCINGDIVDRRSYCQFTQVLHRGDRPFVDRTNSNVFVSSSFKTIRARVNSGNPFRSRLPDLANNLTTALHLRHLPSLSSRLSKLKAVILGEHLASDDDLILPSHDFSQKAHVSSFDKVIPLISSLIKKNLTIDVH